ncbi:hypothetical protein HKT18_04855 [Flavobacterium sp. IMCC34852]|uniref:Tetratricopeptide repeat protein n=1 Tax=Flavobacterium rivulicola TaxID=2732161 RepID=A0A7Y3R7W8_9FLAO|nr:hypothetical protein [Flavobacterium sp. IMCC34852]NNT71543.1 hypothetical protein [Flavobacterium sp. IMCC34852]
MKKILYLILLTNISNTIFSQPFKRTVFDYKQLPYSYAKCDDTVLAELDKAINAVNQYNSSEAVLIAKAIYDTHENCTESHLIYGMSLFRNGKVLEGLEIIDKAISKFGSFPDLIKQRISMQLELYENGVGQKNIDGNSIFTSGKNALPFEEEQFKSENLNNALTDLEYLTSLLPDDFNNQYLFGRVLQTKNEFEKSNIVFEKLTQVPDYSLVAKYNLAQNYNSLKQYDKAENEYLSLLEIKPDEPEILRAIARFYEEQNKATQQEHYEKLAYYFTCVPNFLDFPYTPENFNMVSIFGDGKIPAKEKSEKLKDIQKNQPQEILINICLVILNIHTNHGNGLETEATKILQKIGKPALDKTHQLLFTDISTCTVSNLGEIMATVKDESSWNVFVEYLPNIANMPSTLIPPNMPELIIQFDEERGLKEVLKITKGLLSQEKKQSDSPFAGLGSDYVFYLPLKELNTQKVIKAAKDLGYTEAEIALLKKEIKD